MELVIKNPAKLQNDTFKLTVDPTTTLIQLKHILNVQYPGNPRPEAVTVRAIPTPCRTVVFAARTLTCHTTFLQLIYAGKVLKDAYAPIASIFPADSARQGVVLHIVVKPSASPAPPRPPAQPLAAPHGPSQEERQSAENAPAAVTQVAAPTLEPSASQPEPEIDSEEAPHAPTAAPTVGAPQAVATSLGGAFVAGGAQQSPLYGSVYAAAYQAALQALLGHQGPAAPPVVGASSIAQSASGSQGQGSQGQGQAGSAASHVGASPHAFAFVPTMVPVPQPVLPQAFFQAHMHAAQPHQHGQGAAHPAPHPPAQMFMPVVPMGMHFGYPPAHAMHFHHAPAGEIGLRQRLNALRRQQQQEQAQAAQPRGAGHTLDPELVGLLRGLQAQGAELPPNLAQALDAAEARQGAAAHGRPIPRRLAQMQIRVRVNLRALLQLAVLLVVVYQHCPPRRFILLLVVGAVLYLSTTPRVREFLQRVTGWNVGPRVRPAAPPMPAQAPERGAHQNGAAAPAAANGGAPAREGAGPAPGVPNAGGADGGGAGGHAAPLRRGGILNEIQAFVTGFITSLLPALDRDPGVPGGAAFEAAGEMRNVF